jgi:tripartite-type tricarboxylate transporter receptor subunit TctC
MLCKSIVAAMMAGMALCSSMATAAEFPSQPIRIIVPFPPGASTDVVTRLVAEELRRSLGQTVIVENRPGGTGQIGVSALAHSMPDGYTIGLGNEATHVTVPLLKKRPAFDPVKDFTPLTIAIRTTMAIAVNPAVLRVRSLPELIEAARTRPGGISFGTPGTGSPQHLIGELLKQRSGANFVHIPYSGSALATNDLLAGHIPMIVSTLPALMAHRDKLTIIAIGESERLPYLPDVPTISETMADFVVGGWSGYFGPAKLPGPISARLNAALVSALHNPLVVEAIRKQSLEPAGTSAQDLLALVKSGLERWAPVIERAQIAKED